MTALFAYVEISVVRFANPVFLAFAAIVPVAALYAAVLMARREMALAKMSSDPPRMRFRSLQLMLVSAGLVMAFLAAARPQWGRSEERRTVSSRNLVIAIDVSRSMLAEDVRPNRLERAKADLAALVKSLDGDRCALVAFARVEVPAGGEALARFELPREAFATVDADGVRAVRPGRYVVTVADCAPVPCALASGRAEPVSFELSIA